MAYSETIWSTWLPRPLPQSHFFVKFLAASTPGTQDSPSPRELHLGFLGQSWTFLGLASNRFKKWAGLGIYYSSGQKSIKENSAEGASGKFWESLRCSGLEMLCCVRTQCVSCGRPLANIKGEAELSSWHAEGGRGERLEKHGSWK